MFNDIRAVFAQTQDAKMRGYGPGRHRHLDRAAAGGALYRQADRPHQPAGAEPGQGHGTDGRAAV